MDQRYQGSEGIQEEGIEVAGQPSEINEQVDEMMQKQNPVPYAAAVFISKKKKDGHKYQKNQI